MDERMTILTGVFPVGCKLATESASYTEADGLLAVEEAISTQPSVASRVPPSWVEARQVVRTGRDLEVKTKYQAFGASLAPCYV